MAISEIFLVKYIGTVSPYTDDRFGSGTWTTGLIKAIDSDTSSNLQSDFKKYTIMQTQPQPYVLSQGAVPYGIANSGTIATNGTVTLGTALNTTYSGGIWLYFPAAAFAASAAGFYWCVMSSTTVGVVYTSDTSAVAVTGSNSAYTGDTTQRTAVSVTIPGGSMGANGSVRHHAGHSINNTAGNKVTSTFFGATSIFTATGTTNTSMGYEAVTTNKNSASSQRTSNLGVTGATGQGAFSAIDTNTDSLLTFRLQLAVATDVLVLENWLVELLPGA
jgi:hypothetical protein